MKKLFAVLLASLLVLSLTACGGKSDDSAGSDSAPADLNLEDVYQSLLDQQPKDATNWLCSRKAARTFLTASTPD